MRAYIKTNPDNPTIKRPYYTGDVGYDLIASSEPNVIGERKNSDSPLWKHIDYIEYETNVAVAPEDESIFYSLVYPRSSISKYNLILANSVGVIDSGYRETIKLRFKYICQPQDFTVSHDAIRFYQKRKKIQERRQDRPTRLDVSQQAFCGVHRKFTAI